MVDKIKAPKGTPGQIYSSISVDSRDFGTDSEKLKRKKENSYVVFCKKIYSKYPGLGNNTKYNPKYQFAINFLKWDLSAEEYNAGNKFVIIIGLAITIITAFLIYIFGIKFLINMFGNQIISMFIAFGIPLIIFIYVFTTFQKYPLSAVKNEKIKALTFVPEILGYMIMSMKLVPNLEKAVEFASSHGHGKISEDLKILLWEVKVGMKNSVAEAMDELAYKWGDVSEELKKGFMKIRSSVIEVSEAKRYQILDKAMEDTLESIKGKLEDYARSLTEPSMIMFYIGILLPLLLIIVLPVGSAFSGSALAKPIYLVLIYNIGIPIGCIFFTIKVINGRPSTYIPPKIPDNHPDLPPKNTIKIGKNYINIFIVLFIVGVLILGITLYLQNTFGQTKKNILIERGYIIEGESINDAKFNCTNQELEKKASNPNFMCASELEFWQQPENDTTPFYLIYGALLLISVLISLYLYADSIYKRKIQLESEKMEDEFKDALYIIASRLGENKPIEDALSHTKNFLPRSLIAKNIFGKAIDNIKVLGLNLNSAMFDKNYGALKNNPSRVINSAMRLMIDSVQLGVSVAAKTLMSYSMQLRNTDKVAKMLKSLIISITGTLKSMAKFIAPIVLGITTALQKIVVSTLNTMADSGTLNEVGDAVEGIESGLSQLGGSVNINSVQSMGQIDTATVAQLASSTTFLIIVALYVVQIVIIITYFTTMIEQDNITLAKLRIAQTLPVAIIIFIITTILSNMIF